MWPTHKILSAIVFLTAFVIWVSLIQVIMRPTMKSGALPTFWRRQGLALLSSLGIVTFIFLVSGYFNPAMLGLLVGADELAVLVGSALQKVFGPSGGKAQDRIRWENGELTSKYLVGLGLVMIVPMFAGLAYPIISIVTLFRHTGSELTTHIFLYTFILLFCSGFFATIPIIIFTLASEDLDEPSRTWIFLGQLPSLFSVALYLCVMLSAIGFRETGLRISLGSLTTVLSPQILLIVLGYFILVVLVPFLVGSLRARKRRIELLEKRITLLDQFLETLDSPIVATHVSDLETVRKGITAEREQLSQRDKMIGWADAIDQGQPVPKALEQVADAYKASKLLDPRFGFLDWLGKLSTNVENALVDLSSRPDPSDRKKAAENWANAYHLKHEEVDKQIVATRGTKLPASFLIATLFTPVITAVAEEFGHWIWTVFSQGLHTFH